MTDDPRLSVSDCLDAKAAAWKRLHGISPAQTHPARPSSVTGRASVWQKRADDFEQGLEEDTSDSRKGLGTDANIQLRLRMFDPSYVRLKESSKTGPSSVSGRTSLWQKRADDLELALEDNPFSDSYKGYGTESYVQPRRDDATYGRPKEGSKTEYRGKQAGIHVSREIVDLCGNIEEIGEPQADGSVAVTFGRLFEMYTRISNKLVGMLMRARKQHLVTFEGEMLYQRQDDHKIVRLVQRPEQLRAKINSEKDALKHHEQYSTMKK